MRLVSRFLTFLSAALLTLMVACGGSSSSAPTPPPEPLITSFTADKTTIAQGEVVYLTAVYSNGIGTLSPGGGAIPSGQVIAVQPQQTQSYIVTVTNSANATATRALTVVVVPPIGSVTFTASKSNILVGESVELKATFSGGTAVVTSTPAAASITPVSGVPFLVSPTATTAYTLTVTNAAGAKRTEGLIINVQNVAAISSFTATPAAISLGDTATLSYTFTGGTGFINNGVGTVVSGLANVVNPTVTTTYLLTVSNAVGSSAFAAVTVTVAGQPSNVRLTAEHSSITVGESVRLTPVFTSGTAVITNTLDATTIVPVNGLPVTVQPAQTTSYILTVTNAIGASTTAVATVTVVPMPRIISFSGSPLTITRGNSAKLFPVFADGTGSISIDNNVGLGPVESGKQFPVSPTQTTPYTLTVTNATGRFVQLAVTIKVVDPPVGIALVASPPIITIGHSSRLIPTFTEGTATIDHSIGAVLNGVPVPIAPVFALDQLPQSVTYTMTVTNAAGASATTGAVVTVVDNPEITSLTCLPLATPAVPVNVGQDVVITPVFNARGGSAYLSGVGSVVNGFTYTVNPLETTTYTLTVTNPAGDSITRTLTVNVVSKPVIQSFIAYPSTSSAGDTVQLIGIYTGAATLPAGPDAFITPLTTPYTGTPVTSGVATLVKPIVTTTYQLKVTNSAGEFVIRSVTVFVVPLPTAGPFFWDKQIITAGETANFYVTYDGESAIVTPDVGPVLNSLPLATPAVLHTYAVHPTQTTTYTLTATNTVGAKSLSVSTLTVLSGPNAAGIVAKPEIITQGDTFYLTPYFTIGGGGTATVSSTTANSGVPAAPASITVTNAVPFSVTPTAAGTYVYTLTVTNGSTPPVVSTHGVTVIVKVRPNALTLGVAPATPITAGDTATLTPNWAGGGNGVLTPGIGPVIAGQAYTVQPSATTVYTLTVTDAAGTVTSITQTVVVLSGPNAAAITANPTAMTVGVGKSTYLKAYFNVGTGAGATATVTGPVGSHTAQLPVSFPAPGTLLNAVPFPVTPTAAGTYVYTLTASNGATPPVVSTHGVTVTVYDAPVITYFGLNNPAPPAPAVYLQTITIGGSTSLRPDFTGGTGVISGIGPVTPGQGYPISPTATTTYILTVTNPIGDTVTASYTITVVLNPTIESFTATPSTIVAGASSQLIANFSNGTGEITNDQDATTITPLSGAGITVTPAVTTIYTLTVTNAVGTTVARSVTVTVGALPTMTSFTRLPALGVITAGETATLTPTFAGGTGVITPGLGTVGSGIAYAVQPTQTTTYTLAVTNPLGTLFLDQMITVLSGPNAAALTAQPLAITVGDTAHLTGYFTIGTGGTATVNGPAGSFSPYVPAVVAPPTPAIQGQLPMAYPGADPLGGLLQNAVPFPVTPTAAGTYVYTMTVTNSASVTSTHGTTITVHAAPAAALAVGSSTILLGATTTLTPTFPAGMTGVISGIGTVTDGTVYTVAPTTTTTYVLTVTNAAGRTATATQTIVVTNVQFNSTFFFSPTVITEGDTTTLYNTFSGATSAAVTSNATVAELNPIAFTPVSGTPRAVASNPGPGVSPGTWTYTLTLTNNIPTPAFTFTTTANLTVLARPAIASFTANATSATVSISAGQSVNLVPTFSNGLGVINQGIGPVASGASYTVVPTVSTTYTLTVTNAAGTQTTLTRTVLVVSGPYAQALTANPLTVTVNTDTTLSAVFSGIGTTATVTSATTGAPTGFSVVPVTGVPVVVRPDTIGIKIYNLSVTNGIVSHTTGVAVNVVAVPTGSMTRVGSDVLSSGTLFYPGDNITWTITYTDGGSNTNGVFTDVLQGASSTVPSGQTVVTSIPFLLPAGTTLHYTLKVTNAAGTSVVVPVTIILS